MTAHLHDLRQAALRLIARPLSALLSALVIAIALTLPALGWTLIDHLAGLARNMTGQPEISVFLKHEIAGDATRAVEQQLRSHSGIARLRLIPRDQALQQLAARGGFGDISNALTDNPLPDAFILEPRDTSPAGFQALQTQLAALPQVALVQLDAEWVARLAAIVRLARSASLLLALLLGTALIIVTFNTIRLQILTLRHEISVKLLLGATRSAVRRPFLYFGLLQGLLGGLLAWALVSLLLALLAPHIESLAQRYSISLQLNGPAALQVACLLGFAALLGWLGAALSVRRHVQDGLVD